MRRFIYSLVTLIPLAWLVAVTFIASWHKIFNPDPRIGFLSQARQLAAAGANPRLIFNNRLDALVTALLIGTVAVLLIESVRQWVSVLSGQRELRSTESPFVPTRMAKEQG
jgi:carbon starvation protein